MTVLVVAEAAAILLLGLLVAGLLRSHAEILRRLHELGAGMELTCPRRSGGPARRRRSQRPRFSRECGRASRRRARRPRPTVVADVAGVTLDDEAIVWG